MSKQQPISQTISLCDGRQLGYAEFGDPKGFPVVYCHGFPASRLEGGLISAAASRNGARIIAADRPGYGLSDWQPGRSIADWPADLAQLLDHLGINQFAVLAVSGGGPYGLAVLAKLVERVSNAALVCPLGPVYQTELVQAMHGPARFGFTSAQRAPWLTKLVYGRLLGPLMRAKPELALALLTVAMPQADRVILAQADVKAVICASIGEALRQGTRAALWDFHVYSHPWGFNIGEIAAPLLIWHGDADATVPIPHSHALVGMLANAKLNVLADEGHFSLPIKQADKILAELLNPCLNSVDTRV